MFNPIHPGTTVNGHTTDSYGLKDQRQIANTRVQPAEELGIKPQVTHFDVDTVVNNILDFVRQRIASAPLEDQNSLLEQAKEGVLKGFVEAGTMLEDMGRLNPEFESGMDRALEKLNNSLISVENLFAAETDAPKLPSTTKMAQVEWFKSNVQTLSMTITTRDGDTIRLSYSAETMQQATLLSNKHGYMYQWASMENSGLSLMVHGDIDIDEKEALNKLLSDVDLLANEFFDGDLGVAFKMAQELNMDMTELASFNLNMQETDMSSIKTHGHYETDNRVQNLPKGLTLLAQYAKDLVDSIGRLNSGSFFNSSTLLDLLEFHPLQRAEDKPALQSIFNRLISN